MQKVMIMKLKEFILQLEESDIDKPLLFNVPMIFISDIEPPVKGQYMIAYVSCIIEFEDGIQFELSKQSQEFKSSPIGLMSITKYFLGYLKQFYEEKNIEIIMGFLGNSYVNLKLKSLADVNMVEIEAFALIPDMCGRIDCLRCNRKYVKKVGIIGDLRRKLEHEI